MKFKKAIINVKLTVLAALTASSVQAEEVHSNRDVMTGTVEAIYIDHLESKGEVQFFLNPGNKQVPVRMEFPGKSPENLHPGDKISIRGLSKGRVFQVETIDAPADSSTNETSTDLANANINAVAERKVITILVNMKNGVNSTGSHSLTSGDLFDNTLSTASQYHASSYGQVTFQRDSDGDGDADIFGPYTINADASGACDVYDWAYKAEAAAEAAGINLSQYHHKVFVLPRYDQLAQCSWAGTANVSCGDSCRAWVAYNHGGLYSHELGHNLGMMHSTLDSNNDGVIENHYGDWSGVMGSPYYWNHFNAPHKVQMGWLASYPDSTIDVAGVGSGSYQIGALELDQNTDQPGTQVLTHPRAAGGNYYVSFRQTIGDFGVKSEYNDRISLHHFSGGMKEVHFIKSLAAGETFSDTSSGFSVTFHGKSGNFANVSVSSNVESGSTCTASSPSLSLSPANQSGIPGDLFSYNLSLKNNDSSDCSSTSFNLSANTGSLTSSLSSGTLSLAPGASGSVTLTVNTSIDNSEGSYQFTGSVSSSNHSSSSVTGKLSLDSSAPTAPANLNGSAKRKALNLSWSASSDTVSGVAYYRVFRNGVKIAERSSTDYSDRDLVSGSSYSYTVDAVDNAGHISPLSNTFNFSASSGGGGNKGKKPAR